jgi:hypothetical protein
VGASVAAGAVLSASDVPLSQATRVSISRPINIKNQKRFMGYSSIQKFVWCEMFGRNESGGVNHINTLTF